MPAAGRRRREGPPGVCGHLARVLDPREIAAALVVEEATVKTHVKRVLAKLAVRDRVQAVIVAWSRGSFEVGRARTPP
jgi:DNA-binding NarL/FixJ family response regulator